MITASVMKGLNLPFNITVPDNQYSKILILPGLQRRISKQINTDFLENTNPIEISK